MVEGVWRFKHNDDLLERRRIAFATFTLVIATAAFTIKDGVPAIAALAGLTILYPWWVTLPLFVLSAFAAAGITYAVAVHRVLAPRVVVRQSLQYALARRTLGIAAALPTTLLVVSLVQQRDRSLAEIVSGQPLFYAVLLVTVIAAIRYRDTARAWLDRHFFRQEYDARAVLLSLSGRIPFETDPNELTALVVAQIDAALHPTMVAVLVAGVEPGTLVPVSVLHGTADTLDQRGGIGTMLTWSDTPLELDLGDERSAAGRLPADEIEWLRCTGAVLFVPLSASESGTRQLLGALVLGEKRSEEPYTADDRALLSSIAAQVSLGLDVARLRRRQTLAADGSAATALPTNLPTSAQGAGEWLVAECQVCGTCHDSDVPTCSKDGTALKRGRLPRMVDTKYRVDRVLGRGGMGAVYCAHDMRLERDVAIKVVRAELLSDPDARTRFRREAQLVARLQHPGIVSVFDYGTLPDGAAFLVMEYVRGRDLRAVLRADGPMPPERVASLLRAIAAPVDSAHQLGVLHRDLKPENILLPDSDAGAGVGAKVLDFGVAKLLGGDGAAQENETLTLAGQPIGTPAYMAPEQLAGASVSTRTHVFALGAIAYELLTGVPPFGRGPLVEIATRHRTGPAPIDRDDVPPAMTDAISRALSVDAGMRPESATAFAMSLG
ncbi:MAG: serine/threonine protein kinase [Vicinamibacteria bacterium]|nr:serine/threonine protein kinase [Vicinamibacteria bacterium]